MILWSYETPTGGRLLDLSGRDGIDELGVSGGWMPEYERISRQTPGGSGEITERVRARPRTVVVPVCIVQAEQDDTNLDSLLRDLADTVGPEDGPGRLIATRVDRAGQPLMDTDGNVRARALRAFYTGGLEVERTWGDTYGGWWQTAGLVFYADQPYYEPLKPKVRRFGATQPVPWFPMLPLNVGSDSLLGESVEINDGATEAFPVVTIDNPGSLLTVANVTTGQVWQLDTTPAEGQQIVIDTRPSWLGGGRTVTRADGASLYRYLTGELWAFQQGPNLLDLAVDGGDPTLTGITVAYAPQYRTP